MSVRPKSDPSVTDFALKKRERRVTSPRKRREERLV